ncbi:hypothetical protein NQ318_004295 [Aromia moschata]|uniref:Uncharacterized protein n=1 Tax=Aromia moschata TaxID=1265417 RepID=A0AAV8YTJ7_9CUCU|nr:hypothetical protein NQ318_004295 [Aromia moschata]
MIDSLLQPDRPPAPPQPVVQGYFGGVLRPELSLFGYDFFRQFGASDWSIEHLLAKWGLECHVHGIGGLGASAGLDVHELIGDHSIHLLKISRKS